MNEKNLKLRKINNLLNLHDKTQKCPLDGSQFTSDCQFCETCEKFIDYLRNEIGVEVDNGRYVFVTKEEAKRGKFIRTPEHIKKMTDIKTKQKNRRIARVEAEVMKTDDIFSREQIVDKLDENDTFVMVVLKNMRHDGKITRVIQNRYEYNFMRVKQ